MRSITIVRAVLALFAAAFSTAAARSHSYSTTTTLSTTKTHSTTTTRSSTISLSTTTSHSSPTTLSTSTTHSTSTTTHSTTKNPSTTTTLATTTSPAQGSPPTECPIPVWTVTTFSWFNSTHNLDCYSGSDLSKTGCINETGTIEWCDPSVSTCQMCGVALCSGGLPTQPVGYGPADTLTIDVQNGYACSDINPKSYRRHDLGNGEVECGTGASVMEFYGSSNAATSQGTVDYHPPNAYSCTDGRTISASGAVTFTMTCTHDAGFNATCTAAPFVIPVTSWTIN